MGDTSRGDRRRYDNRARAEKAAQTRERIITAGSELVHAFDSWNWQELTFRSVAERAGVGERTVYRHFPTERQLHDAVMQRLESEAGISYEDVDLHNLGEVTARVFASLQRFAVRESVETPRDPTFVGVDARRREALKRAVADSAPGWSVSQQRVTAGLLDVLWNLPSYERLVGVWGVDGATATDAVNWLMAKIVDAVEEGDPPPA